MYNHQIDEMAKEIGKGLGFVSSKGSIINVPAFINIIHSLEWYWKNKIAITWTTNDVQTRAAEIGKGKITKRRARLILDAIMHKQDATIGVNWDTIDNEIIDQVPEKAQSIG